MGVGQLNDIADSSRVAAFGQVEIFLGLDYDLLADPNPLRRLVDVKDALAYPKRNLEPQGFLTRLKVTQFSLRFADLAHSPDIVKNRNAERQPPLPAVLQGHFTPRPIVLRITRNRRQVLFLQSGDPLAGSKLLGLNAA